jgi:Flp pilus assembly protein TadG
MDHEAGLRTPPNRWSALLRRPEALLSSSEGIAAVEFALILPLMVAMYLGLIVLTTGVSMDRKLTLMSRSLADLTGRDPSISNADLAEIFEVATEIMQPYDGMRARIRISSIIVKQKQNSPDVEGHVCWTEVPPEPGRAPTSPAANLKAGDIIPVPEGFRTPNTSFIQAHAEFDYVPIVSQDFLGTTTLEEVTPWPVRNVQQVARNGVTCAIP